MTATTPDAPSLHALRYRFCPIHYMTDDACREDCVWTRRAFHSASEALRMYWNDRANGRRACRNPDHALGCNQGCPRPKLSTTTYNNGHCLGCGKPMAFGSRRHYHGFTCRELARQKAAG